MADLISRAAAIDAIVSATAFPDAEYIKNLCQNPANSEDWLGGVFDAINAVEDVNTVDAIPVGWLEEKRDSQNDPWDYLANAIDYILAVYKKEQEAR